MSAITRWNLYSIADSGTIGMGGTTISGLGTRGFTLGTASVDDKFNIGSNNNRLHLHIDGNNSTYVTLTSGTNLDPRFVAKDITEQIHNLSKGDVWWDQAQCVWENNHFKLYSGSLGTNSSAVVVSGTNTVHTEIGFGGAPTEAAGSASTNTFNGGITVSGTYSGFFDETYRVVINKETSVGAAQKGGTSYTGEATSAGTFNHASDITYSISISISNGSSMGGRTGNVPTMTWTSTGGADDSTAAVELLYPDFWYQLGTKGVMIKFEDAVFDTFTDAFTVACTYPQYVVNTDTNAAVGTAKYIWGSSRGDKCTVVQDTSVGWNAIGTRGVYIKFHGSNNLSAGDEFRIICTPPKPQSYDITTLNYGNVTVSTESSLRAVSFEILSGAVEISTVKFGLQNHGSFSHHDAGDNDTKMRFGTVGPGNNPLSPTGAEWKTNVTASDISSDTPPSYLYATKEDLGVVSDADASETIGSSSFAGMCADPIWLNVKLGSSEVGSNSQINMRLFFDYS